MSLQESERVARGCPGSRRESVRVGVTLAELLVVVALLAVAAGIVVQSVEAWAPAGVEAAGRMIAADLRHARERAVRTGRPHALLVNAEQNRYWVVEAGGAVPDPLNPGRPGVLVRDLTERIGGGVRIESPLAIPSRTRAATVLFDPAGGATAAGGDAGGATDGEDAVLWVRGPVGGGWQVVRVRAVAATGQVWVDGPHPYDATLPSALSVGEPELGAADGS